MREFDCPGACIKYGWILKEPVHAIVNPPKFISNEVTCAALEGRICMAANIAIIPPDAATCVDRKNRPATEKCPYL